jgi:sugar/nucleoside kinase (ribokinase family)
VLAEEKHQPVYAELVKDFKVDYIAGGAGQNTVRVCQWMLNACGQRPGACAYFGAVGADAYAEQMKAQAAKDGVNVQVVVMTALWVPPPPSVLIVAPPSRRPARTHDAPLPPCA